MARSNVFDQVGSYNFWLFDIPRLGWTPIALLPIVGFQTVSAMELNATAEEINPGNEFFPTKAITGGTVTTITCTRGVVWWDSDFFRWVRSAIEGRQGSPKLPPVSARRDLVLVWFHDLVRLGDMPTGLDKVAGLVPKLPCKGYFLKDCMPVRYKAGSDFDANSAERSIQEIDLEPHSIDEISLFG